jgi:hypothetical protein
VGLVVQRLRRGALGPLELGGLPPGQWRELTPLEVKRLAAEGRTMPPVGRQPDRHGWRGPSPGPERGPGLLRIVGNQAATAIDNARTYRMVEQLGRLKRFFSPQLAELIIRGGTDDPLKTHRREVTVLFLDLRGFTAFAETSEPEEVMGALREYHAEMGGVVDILLFDYVMDTHVTSTAGPINRLTHHRLEPGEPA